MKMISPLQAIILGLLQGVTELFPISSLGHSIILPGLLGWHLDSNATDFVRFLVATHLATALVLFFIYWKDWVRIIKGLFRSLAAREIPAADTDAKLGWLLVVGTIPVGILGLLFEKQAKQFFTSPRQAALFLVVNGAMLFGAELLRRRRGAQPETLVGADERLAKLSFTQTLKIGAMQVLALFPGISRTGSAITGGLLTDLSHEDALRFSFLLATPVIGAAALLELPGLFTSDPATMTTALVGAITAAGAAYLSVKFLVRYFRTQTLAPFAAYCAVAGALALLLIR
jgi:undecaprenyl-diphosphatase